MIEMLSSHLKNKKGTLYGLVKKVCVALTFLLDNIYIDWQFGTKLYKQIMSIPMDTSCLLTDLFLYCYMKAISWCLFLGIRMLKLGKLSTQSLYLDDLLNIDNTYFDGMVNQICPSEQGYQ